MKKKLFAIIATVALVVTMIPSMVFADATYVAEVGGVQYPSLQEAFDEAEDGQTVKMLENIDIDASTVTTKTSDDKSVLFYIEGKSIKLDMNGKTITADFKNGSDSKMYFAIFCIANGASLEVKGNGTVDAINVKPVEDAAIKKDGTVQNLGYMFWKRSGSDDSAVSGTLTVQNGDYKANNLEDSLIYTNNDGIVTVNGGNFIVAETGNRENGSPWIFNAQYSDANRIIVNGGTFNADVNHQFWEYEVSIDKTKALKNNGNKTWTVVDAVAYVDEHHTKYPNYSYYKREIGYATLEEAVAAANTYKDDFNQDKANIDFEKITLLKDAQISNTLHFEGDKDFIINLNGKKLIWKGNDNTPIVSFDNGATLNKDSKKLDPSKEGYTFKGWYTDANYENAWNWDFESLNSQTRATANVTSLYAKWTEAPVPEKSPDTGDNSLPYTLAVAGLALAAMAAVVATRRRTN